MTRLKQFLRREADAWLARRHARLAETRSERRGQIDAERLRTWLFASLIFVAAVMLFEVVILPGSMIRHHLSHGGEGAGTNEGEGSTQVGGRSPNASGLADTAAALDADWKAFCADVERRYRVKLDTAVTTDATPMPDAIRDVARTSPSATIAWNDIWQSARQINASLQRTKTASQDEPLTSRSQPEAAADRTDEIMTDLTRARRLLEAARTELEHLRFLQPVSTQPGAAS
jgi:hypothetical protein